MQEFKHPHVLPLIGVCLDTGPGISMVMPFMANGSLLDYLKKERNNLEVKGDEPDKVCILRIPKLCFRNRIKFVLRFCLLGVIGGHRNCP